jgi:enoyl-CoA hydratase/carnithine racemase
MTESMEEPGPVGLEIGSRGIAILTLDRPSQFNSLRQETLAAFEAALDRVDDAGIRVLIITGSGRAFCGGAYVKYFTDPSSPFFDDPTAVRDIYVRRIVRIFHRLQGGPFPTIAAINGFAFGGGFELAIACDFRLMAASASIGLTEVRLGAVAGAGGVTSLARLVGRARALEIVLLGEKMGSAEALAMGVVNSVHPDDRLMDAAGALALRLLRCSPVSIAQSKQAVYRSEGLDIDGAGEIGLDAVAVAAGTGDWREGMTSFVERRRPAFDAADGPAGGGR